MNYRPLCVSPRCKRDPDGNPAPRYALDGSALCIVCRNMLGEDALIAAVRYRQLALVLTGAGRVGEEQVKRSKADANLTLNLRAAALRRDIEREIGGLATLICDRRGFHWPADRRVAERPYEFIGPMPLLSLPTTRLPPLCRLVARSRDWLAAREDAGTHAAMLRDLATGQAFRVAFPGGVRRFLLPGMGGDQYLGCPEEVDDEPCPGVLWTILRRDGEVLPSQIACNEYEDHLWPIREWVRLGRRLMRLAGVEAA
jgi:hypothetical protein